MMGVKFMSGLVIGVLEIWVWLVVFIVCSVLFMGMFLVGGCLGVVVMFCVLCMCVIFISLFRVLRFFGKFV